MNMMDIITDPYNRRARLQPALFVVLPVFLVGLLLFPEIETRATTFIMLFVLLGGSVWITQLGRERGKKIEPKLYDIWGGKPSVALIRHQDNRINSMTKARYHQFMQHNVPQLQLPSSEKESKEPHTADDMYQAATDWLLAKTRDTTKFRLLFEENMNYGFRRNLYALKPLALILDFALGVFLLVTMTSKELIGSDDVYQTITGLDSHILISLSIVCLHALAMMTVVTHTWVKTTADAFGQQLLAACDALP